MSSIAMNFFKCEDSIDSETNLTNAVISKDYRIRGIETDDDELRDFLFSLGCFEGESVTVISALAENYVINVKDARYSIDADLAKAIII